MNSSNDLAKKVFSGEEDLAATLSQQAKAANAMLGTNISPGGKESIGKGLQHTRAALPAYKAKGKAAKDGMNGLRDTYRGVSGRNRSKIRSSRMSQFSNLDEKTQAEVGRLLNQPNAPITGDNIMQASAKAEMDRLGGSASLPGTLPAAAGKESKQGEAADENAVAVDKQDQGRFARAFSKLRTGARQKKLDKQASEEATADSAAGKQQKGMGNIGFMLIFMLAGVKDLIDFLSLGWIGTLVNIAVTPTIILVLMLQGQSMKDLVTKRKALIAGGILAEFIPFVSFIPAWTLGVLWLKLEASGMGNMALGKLKTMAPAIIKKMPFIGKK
ncbi:hypothetical protein KKF61_06825 [Patescibacteria group bacterium]|nr:hypothetical protein [Patescibacteria group bacterium]MBU0963618.1 hypothetical protein [Patescibacteria group bacterium]